MFHQREIKIFKLEKEIKQIQREMMNVQSDIQSLLLELQKPNCCFEDKNHVIIVTSDSKWYHMNVHFLEEKCPQLKEIAGISIERGQLYYRVDIDSSIMGEIMNYWNHQTVSPNCKFTIEFTKIVKMLEIEELANLCEISLLKTLTVDNSIKMLDFSVVYSLNFLKEMIVEFITKNYEEIKTHRQWNDFCQNHFQLNIEILSKLEFTRKFH